MSRDLKYQKENIELRRGKVLELFSKGHSQTEIAKTLNVSNALISLDIQYVKEQARKELETHIQERVPLEYKRAMTGLDNILKRANEMLEKITDPKTQIQNMSLLMDLYKTIMFLCTDGSIIERAMKKVTGLQTQQSQSANLPDEESTPTEPEEDLREE